MKRIFTLLAIAATFVFAISCNKENGGNGKGNGGSADKQPITIDGDFADWAALEAGQFVSAKNNPNSNFEGVKEIRVTANEDFVYYYIKFDQTTLEEQLEKNDKLNIRLCLNTDGEFTSGYDQYFLESYDFIVEGPLGNGEGGFGKFDGTMHQRVYNEAESKMAWIALLEIGNNIAMGAGAGNEYEIVLARDIFNGAIASSTEPNQPIGDVFQTGIRFYCDGWAELSNMPNAEVDEDNTHGWGHMLEVHTQK